MTTLPHCPTTLYLSVSHHLGVARSLNPELSIRFRMFLLQCTGPHAIFKSQEDCNL